MGIMRDGSKAKETREGMAHAPERWSASHPGAGRRAYLCRRARLRTPREHRQARACASWGRGARAKEISGVNAGRADIAAPARRAMRVQWAGAAVPRRRSCERAPA